MERGCAVSGSINTGGPSSSTWEPLPLPTNGASSPRSIARKSAPVHRDSVNNVWARASAATRPSTALAKAGMDSARVSRSTACTTARAFLARWSTSRMSSTCRSSACLRAVMSTLTPRIGPIRPAGLGIRRPRPMSHSVSSPPLRPGRRTRNSARYSPEARASCMASRTVPRSSGWTMRQEGLERIRLARRRGQAEQGVMLGRPEKGIRLRVPFPGADPGHLLRQPEPRLAGPQRRLGGLERGGVGVQFQHGGRLAIGRVAAEDPVRGDDHVLAIAAAVPQLALPLAGVLQLLGQGAAAAIGEARAEELVGGAPERLVRREAEQALAARRPVQDGALRGAQDGGTHVKGGKEVSGQGLRAGPADALRRLARRLRRTLGRTAAPSFASPAAPTIHQLPAPLTATSSPCPTCCRWRYAPAHTKRVSGRRPGAAGGGSGGRFMPTRLGETWSDFSNPRTSTAGFGRPVRPQAEMYSDGYAPFPAMESMPTATGPDAGHVPVRLNNVGEKIRFPTRPPRKVRRPTSRGAD